MTTLDRTRSVPLQTDAHPFTTAGKVKATVGLAIGGVATAVILGTAQTGPEGDPRLTHPDPTGEYLVGGYPRPEPPLWGVENWPVVFGTLFLVVATIVMAPFVIRSIRDRRVNQGLMVFSAVAILAWLDPVANWVTYTVYDPRLLHFPTTWTWMRFAPSVEPLLVVPGYPFYFFIIALIAFGFGQRYILPRFAPGSWFRRHPRATLFMVGFATAAVWDVPMELLMIRARMYTYTQFWGPSIHVGNAHAGLPIVWTLFTIVTIAAITPLLHRDDDGGSVLSSVGRRLPRFSRRSTTNQPTGQSAGRQIVAGALVLSVVYLALTAFFGFFRITGLSDNLPNGGWPYGEIKTYDPDGFLEEEGIPGTYYS